MKRHTKQNEKQKLGQFFTTNSDLVLSGFEDFVVGKSVIDPFAGNKDLLNWATKNGAKSATGYDLVPRYADIIQNDSIKHPPDYAGSLVLSNPPYLAKNKSKSKDEFNQWGFDNLYKCHLASLKDVDEYIVIVPTNFLCESRSKIRDLVFSTHSITKAVYWKESPFDDTNQTVVVFHTIKGGGEQNFKLTFMPEGKEIEVTLKKKYGYLFGDDFFEYINRPPVIEIQKVNKGDAPPNTNIIISLLDNGKWKSGINYNDDEPIYCKPTSFTTYQISIYPELSIKQQKDLVVNFQNKFGNFRNKYDNLFLSNYMGPEQKILSRNFVHKMINAVYERCII